MPLASWLEPPSNLAHERLDDMDERSIAAAKQHQQDERQHVSAVTGIAFNGDQIVLPTKPHKVACGLCNYTAHAKREGQAVNSVAAHIVSQHFPQHVKE